MPARRAARRFVASIAAVSTACAISILGFSSVSGAAGPANGTIVPGADAPTGTFANAPFSSGQSINVTVPANSLFTSNNDINIVECTALQSNEGIPTDPSNCDGNTINGGTIHPSAVDGSFTASFTLYSLPNAGLGENNGPACSLSVACILYIGLNQNDFTVNHVWSPVFYINPTAGNTGVNPGNGSAASTTGLVASPTSSSVYGQSVTLTATVSAVVPSIGTPTGTVTFEDASTTLGTGTLNGSDVATLATTALPVGAGQLITAVYGGDTVFGGSTSTPVTYTVSQASTTTVVNVSPPSPSVYGQSVTYTATVAPIAPGAGTPTGTVTFKDGTTTLGTGTLSAGVATLTTSSLAVGSSHSITGVYGGTTDYAGSTSSALAYTVGMTPTSSTLTSTANPSLTNASVTLTDTVSATPAGTGPTGTVTFKDNGATLGSGTLSGSGVATLTTTALAPGTHPLTAVYGGDGNYIASTSNTVNQSVLTPTAFTITVNGGSSASLSSGAPATFAESGLPATAAGTVAFKSGATTLCSIVLTGLAGEPTTCTTSSSLPGGTYSGIAGTFTDSDGLFAGSNSSNSVILTLSSGYWTVASDGGIFAFGGAPFYGSAGSIVLNKPVVGMAPTLDHHGYWLVASDGGIFSYGDAKFYGSTGNIVLNKPIVGMAVTPDGKGYWLVASDGGIFAFGDAQFYGSAVGFTTSSIVGMASTGTGGYRLAGSNGQVYSFGNAKDFGPDSPTYLGTPVVGITSSNDGAGFWLVTAGGGVFSFGDAVAHGSALGAALNSPVVGMATTPDGAGYWLVAGDGGIFTYGDAKFFGSTGAIVLNKPMIGMADAS